MVTVELVGGPLDGQRWKIREDMASFGVPPEAPVTALILAVTPTVRGHWYSLMPAPTSGTADVVTPGSIRRGSYHRRRVEDSGADAAPRMDWQNEKRISSASAPSALPPA
jgi:hypothetical protein